MGPPSSSPLSAFSLDGNERTNTSNNTQGIINADIDAAAQALKYALAGATVISVLTEPHWFKGSVADLHAVSQTLHTYAQTHPGTLNRPCVLLKVVSATSLFVFSSCFLNTYTHTQARIPPPLLIFIADSMYFVL